jgi:dihydrofolate reductase
VRRVVINHLSLDGVMQSPGRADEDTRGGFRHGGWATAASDEALQGAVGERMGAAGSALLLGRRSYEDMLASWNERGGPFKDGLNAMSKHVASRDPATELSWPNSSLLGGDVPAGVGDLKRGDGGNLVVMGSGELVRSLLPHGLVDELLLMIHPLVLGSGTHLFDDGDDAAGLRLLSARPTATGVILAAYAPA